ncbi:MAG: LysR family transcriptional regulator [Clostridiales bacterium]|nr:LysR family transcriptional regulator [Clostridiales bacterium]
MRDYTLRPVLSVRLFCDNEKSFGPGIAELLRRVREKGSLRAAAASMNMAYSKAWRIAHEMEQALGYPILVSTTGGKNGGGAILTDEGEALFSAYQAYVNALQADAERLFQEYFAQCPSSPFPRR